MQRQLAGAINKPLHFRTVVRCGNGLRRVYIRRYRFVSEERGTDKGLETEFTIYVEFGPGSTPVLMVKEAEITTKGSSVGMHAGELGIVAGGNTCGLQAGPSFRPEPLRVLRCPAGAKEAVQLSAWRFY